jgi:hypothetical protein
MQTEPVRNGVSKRADHNPIVEPDQDLHNMQQVKYFLDEVMKRLQNGDRNGAAQELRLAAEFVEKGEPRVLLRDDRAQDNPAGDRTLAKKMLFRCATIAQRLGHEIAGLREALLDREDLVEAKRLLDAYVIREHGLPAVAASWQGLEKIAMDMSVTLTKGDLEALRFLSGRYDSAEILHNGLQPVDAHADGALEGGDYSPPDAYKFTVPEHVLWEVLDATEGDGGDRGTIPNLDSPAIQNLLDSVV